MATPRYVVAQKNSVWVVVMARMILSYHADKDEADKAAQRYIAEDQARNETDKLMREA